ncbi:NAD(P)-binding domain-containing protein [Nocardia sp. NPDC003482]
MIIGLLHPGNMGSAVGARLVGAGHTVLWCRQGRSTSTRDRAANAGLTPVDELGDLLGRAEIVFAICPSAAAIDLAESVAEHRYRGIYVDANAVSPGQMQHIAGLLSETGAAVVDAAISGPPPRDAPTAKFFLAGPEAPRVRCAQLLTEAGLDADEIGENPWAASALKMALISYQRAARLLAAIAQGLADHHGVTDVLSAEARRVGADMLAQRDALPGVAARAWRWVPETSEVALSLEEAGLPTDYADITGKLMALYIPDKDNWNLPPGDVIRRLIAE